VQVALLEAGGSDRALKVTAPGLYYTQWRTPLDWDYSTEPQAHVDGRRMHWPRGRMLGGCSSMNACVYIRGHRDDYDAWRDAGNPGWGWDDVLPYFMRSENQRRGAIPGHGVGGPLDVADPVGHSGASLAFVEALAKRTGVKRVDDFNGGDSEGAGLFQMTIRDGVRCSTSLAFLAPAKARPNLTVISGAHALGLVAEGSRIAGVRYRARGGIQTMRARREVVLAAGAIGSPHLLLLSGIGPAAHLREHGVPVLVDAPGVGADLQDHLMMPVVFEVVTDAAPRFTYRLLLGQLARYLVRKTGILAKTAVDAGGFLKLDPAAPRPDLQFHFLAGASFEPNTDEARPVPMGTRRVTILPSLIYPRSRGTLRLRSSDPTAPPVIDPGYLADPADRRTLVEGVKLSREIATTAPLAQHLGAERMPSPAAADDEAILAGIRRHVMTIFHPVGTCRMGSDPGAVVDPALRVRGVDGLRVVDASIMPSIVGGNTNAPTIMIAEKAADLIRMGAR
jgi:choline dehydrogenase